MLLRWLSARFPEHVPSPEETARILRSSQWVSKDTVMEAFLSVLDSIDNLRDCPFRSLLIQGLSMLLQGQ